MVSPVATTPQVGAIALVRNASEVAPAPIDGVTWARGTIVFSACNEDSVSEIRAFGSIEGKRVVCVTAGGGRVLNLLAGRPREIWAVDLNPAQNALFELKVAAMRALTHGEYLRFLGVHAAPDRLATYERMRRRLSTGAQRFFDDRPDLVQAGVLMQGRLERFFTRLARFLRLGHPLGLARLFAFDDLAEQRRYLANWDTWIWRTVAQNAARRWVMRVFSGDPGFYRYVPEEIPLHRALYDRVHRYMWNHLARSNPLLQLVFFGRYIYEPALPSYLNADSYERVKASLDAVHLETVTATLEDALDYAGPSAFDAFSISDVPSYLDDQAFHRLFERVIRGARPGARVCSRSNIHHRPVAPEHAARILCDHDLERDLAIADHSCVHEFLVGKVQ